MTKAVKTKCQLTPTSTSSRFVNVIKSKLMFDRCLCECLAHGLWSLFITIYFCCSMSLRAF